MDKLVCQKCGHEISNEFGVTLSYCTSCGANLINLVEKPNKRLIPILIASLAVASLVGGLILLINIHLVYRPGETNSGDKTPKPTPSIKSLNSVAASEITEVTYQVRSHFGPLMGSDNSYTMTNSISFSRDGTAEKISGKISYDTGVNKDWEGTKHKVVFSREDFERLAQTLVENDFSNLSNMSETESEMRSSTLIIKYSGQTKEFMSDTKGQAEKIMEAVFILSNRINWEND